MVRPRSRSWLVSLAVACALASAPATLAPAFLRQQAPALFAAGEAEAKDLVALHRDLASGGDFRLRVSAALAIGQMGQRASVGPLSKALSDEHPAVRAASSAALAKIGDTSAIRALEAAMARESVASVKAQHAASIAKLNAGAASPASASHRFVVKLGKLANKTGVRSAEVDRTFRDSTRASFAKVPGALIAGDDASSVARARSLPMIAIDGTISKLNSAKSGGDVGWDAQVEYMITQMPSQQLKGSIKGRGKALANAAAVGPTEQAQLQKDAVNAAVESALSDAGGALTAATR